jgi:hypothetical protein
LHEVYDRLHKAGGNVVEQGQTSCYAKSEKSWIDDPARISWETFFTTGESTDYGEGTGEHVARVAHEKILLRACAQSRGAGHGVRLSDRVRRTYWLRPAAAVLAICSCRLTSSARWSP